MTEYNTINYILSLVAAHFQVGALKKVIIFRVLLNLRVFPVTLVLDVVLTGLILLKISLNLFPVHSTLIESKAMDHSLSY